MLPKGSISQWLHARANPSIKWYGDSRTSAEQWEMGREGGSQRALGMLKEAEPAHRVGLVSWQMWSGGQGSPIERRLLVLWWHRGASLSVLHRCHENHQFLVLT